MPNKPGIASLVVVPLFILFMHSAITLNCKTGFSTKEIDYVITELVLAPELDPEKLTISEKLPKKRFSRCLPVSKLARSFNHTGELIATAILSFAFHAGKGSL